MDNIKLPAEFGKSETITPESEVAGRKFYLEMMKKRHAILKSKRDVRKKREANKLARIIKEAKFEAYKEVLDYINDNFGHDPAKVELCRSNWNSVVERFLNQPQSEMQKSKGCLNCKRFENCPIIKAWVEATDSPIESTTFYCSEFKPV